MSQVRQSLMKRVRVTRSPQHKVGRLRHLKIVVDGRQVGSLKVGQTEELNIPDDAAEIWCQMDWARSPRLPLGDRPEVQHYVFGEERFTAAFFSFFFRPGNVFSIREVNNRKIESKAIIRDNCK